MCRYRFKDSREAFTFFFFFKKKQIYVCFRKPKEETH